MLGPAVGGSGTLGVRMQHGKPTSRAQRNAETLFETKNVVDIREVCEGSRGASGGACGTRRQSAAWLVQRASVLQQTPAEANPSSNNPTPDRSRHAHAKTLQTRVSSCGSALATPTGGMGWRNYLLPAAAAAAAAAATAAAAAAAADRGNSSTHHHHRTIRTHQRLDRWRRQDQRDCAQVRGYRRQRAVHTGGDCRPGGVGRLSTERSGCRWQRGGLAQALRPAW